MTLGTPWKVEQVVRVVDGDTVRLRRSRPDDRDGRHYTLTDRDPDGLPHRLCWIDTPERGQPGYREAGADLLAWCTAAVARGPLTAVVYDQSAGWDRLLVDLLDVEGQSASQWMLTEANNGLGWPAYVG